MDEDKNFSNVGKGVKSREKECKIPKRKTRREKMLRDKRKSETKRFTNVNCKNKKKAKRKR